MVWPSQGEEYVGGWADDKPHGEGVHSWYSPPPAVAALPPAAEAGGRASTLLLQLNLSSAPATAPAAAASPPALDTHSPGVSLVGRYSGEFAAGERHGFGTFWYLNGARWAAAKRGAPGA